MVKVAKVARLIPEEWQVQRDKMLNTCSQFHSRKLARSGMVQSLREIQTLAAETHLKR